MNRISTRVLPLVTLGIAAAAIAATYDPRVGQMMVFDRTAIIHGELWRLASGHLYHYSPLHLWSNILPLVVVGAWIERKNRKWFAAGCLLMALAVGASLFLFHSSMGQYGGLSGVLCGLLVIFGLRLSFERGAVQWIGRFTLAVVMIKTGHEWYFGSSWWVDWDAHGFVVMPVSHMSGMIAGAVWLMIQSSMAWESLSFDEKSDTPIRGSSIDRRSNDHFDQSRKERRWWVSL